MKLKECFITHEIAGEQVMVSTGAVRFSGLVRSNKTAAFIVDSLKQPTTKEAVVAAVAEKYDAPVEVIRRDVEGILAKLREIGALDE